MAATLKTMSGKERGNDGGGRGSNCYQLRTSLRTDIGKDVGEERDSIAVIKRIEL